MSNFIYVTKSEWKPVKQEIIEMINEVQDIVRKDFTFRYDFIGSVPLNMVTQDLDSNVGYDFDINIRVNDPNEEYDAKEIKHILMNAFNQVVLSYGYAYCEDNTRVFTIKSIDHYKSKIIHSCDFAVVNDCEDGRQQYIRHNKNQNSYYWEYQPYGFNLEHKIEWLKANKLWDEVKGRYLDKKDNNTIPTKKSRSLRAETINEVCNENGYIE